MKKQKNLTFYDFVKMCNYYGCSKERAYIKGTLYNGYLYRTDKLSAEMKHTLKQYGNVLLFIIRREYAPEQEVSGVFIAHSTSKARNPQILPCA